MKFEYEFNSPPHCKVFKTGSLNGQLVTVKPQLLGREKKEGKKQKHTAPLHTEFWNKIPSTTPLWEESSHSHSSHSMC